MYIRVGYFKNEVFTIHKTRLKHALRVFCWKLLRRVTYFPKSSSPDSIFILEMCARFNFTRPYYRVEDNSNRCGIAVLLKN